MYFVNGEKFSGIFSNDKAEGEGTFYRLCGDVVRGRWIDNKFAGM